MRGITWPILILHTKRWPDFLSIQLLFSTFKQVSSLTFNTWHSLLNPPFQTLSASMNHLSESFLYTENTSFKCAEIQKSHWYSSRTGKQAHSSQLFAHNTEAAHVLVTHFMHLRCRFIYSIALLPLKTPYGWDWQNDYVHAHHKQRYSARTKVKKYDTAHECTDGMNKPMLQYHTAEP